MRPVGKYDAPPSGAFLNHGEFRSGRQWIGSLSDNQIADVTRLADMTSLTGLYLRDNQIADVTPLAYLTSLTQVSLRSNQIADVVPLAGLGLLEFLGLGDNEVVDLSPLTELNSLRWLGLWNSQIEDIGPLLDNAGLGARDIIHVWRNRLDEYSRDQDIPALEDREVRVIRTGHRFFLSPPIRSGKGSSE